MLTMSDGLSDLDEFEFNAWDHVDVDDEYKAYAEQQYDMQKSNPVKDFDKSAPSASGSNG